MTVKETILGIDKGLIVHVRVGGYDLGNHSHCCGVIFQRMAGASVSIAFFRNVWQRSVHS